MPSLSILGYLHLCLSLGVSTWLAGEAMYRSLKGDGTYWQGQQSRHFFFWLPYFPGSKGVLISKGSSSPCSMLTVQS